MLLVPILKFFKKLLMSKQSNRISGGWGSRRETHQESRSKQPTGVKQAWLTQILIRRYFDMVDPFRPLFPNCVLRPQRLLLHGRYVCVSYWTPSVPPPDTLIIWKRCTVFYHHYFPVSLETLRFYLINSRFNNNRIVSKILSHCESYSAIMFSENLC